MQGMLTLTNDFSDVKDVVAVDINTPHIQLLVECFILVKCTVDCAQPDTSRAIAEMIKTIHTALHIIANNNIIDNHHS